MIGILKANPGRIHSLHEFVVAAHAAFPTLMHLPATPCWIVPLALSTMKPACFRDTVDETQPYARCGRRAIAVRRKFRAFRGLVLSQMSPRICWEWSSLLASMSCGIHG